LDSHYINWRGFTESQGRYADAEPLYKRTLAIEEKSLGPEHPAVANTLTTLTSLYIEQGRYSDALPIVQRTISQNRAIGILALWVLDGSQSEKLIAPTQALQSSYTVLQQSASSTVMNSRNLCAKIRI
jgi:tetratricopeptide (TPR) repeat protein